MGAEEGQNMGMLIAECEGVGGWIMMAGIETIIAACWSWSFWYCFLVSAIFSLQLVCIYGMVLCN